MKGKLKTLEEILKNTKYNTSGNSYLIFHSNIYRNIVLYKKNMKNFGNVVNISLWEKFDDRIIYEDNLINNQLYYDEWFEWIGEEPIIKEFDNLINAIEGW